MRLVLALASTTVVESWACLRGPSMSERHRRHEKTACAFATSCGSRGVNGSRSGHVRCQRTTPSSLNSRHRSFTSTGKMVVESKADMKKRGMRSPDLADAFLLTFACGERRKITY